MLVGISPLLGPELLSTLCRMGHGDEIVLADAHFPGESCSQRCLRADGLLIADLLEGILPLFALDTYVDHPVVMMAAVPGDEVDPEVRLTVPAVVLAALPRQQQAFFRPPWIADFRRSPATHNSLERFVDSEESPIDTNHQP